MPKDNIVKKRIICFLVWFQSTHDWQAILPLHCSRRWRKTCRWRKNYGIRKLFYDWQGAQKRLRPRDTFQSPTHPISLTRPHSSHFHSQDYPSTGYVVTCLQFLRQEVQKFQTNLCYLLRPFLKKLMWIFVLSGEVILIVLLLVYSVTWKVPCRRHVLMNNLSSTSSMGQL